MDSVTVLSCVLLVFFCSYSRLGEVPKGEPLVLSSILKAVCFPSFQPTVLKCETFGEHVVNNCI